MKGKVQVACGLILLAIPLLFLLAVKASDWVPEFLGLPYFVLSALTARILPEPFAVCTHVFGPMLTLSGEVLVFYLPAFVLILCGAVNLFRGKLNGLGPDRHSDR
jgi:hypothetical protein